MRAIKLHPALASIALALLLIGLAGCGGSPTQQSASSVMFTAAAQTQSAQGTLVANPAATMTLNPDQNFPLPTGGAGVTSVVVATPVAGTPGASDCDDVDFIEDVTYPDNTQVAPGAAFVKTWRLKNNGTCAWTSGYTLVFVRGEAMGAPSSTALTTGRIEPGQTVDVSISLTAPTTGGTYQADFMLRNAAGQTFGLGDAGDKTFWVKIQVAVPPGIGLDVLARGSEAAWVIEKNGVQSSLTYGGDTASPDGAARLLQNVTLEAGWQAGSLLGMYPPQVNDSLIQGTFPAYTVQSGDYFRANIGFLARSDGTCGSGQVVFRLRYSEGGNIRQLGEWRKSCDGKLIDLNINLDELKGKTVQFILIVASDGSPADDNAVWNSPRVER